MTTLQETLEAFGLNPIDYIIEPFGSGLINHTWKVSGNDKQFILQAINHKVFNQPQAIANNLLLIDNYLKETAPNYLFPAPLAAANGQYLINAGGEYYRLSPFISGSHTVNFISQPKQAYEAARQFGKLTRLLQNFDAGSLAFTLTDFHNLSLRVSQFDYAVKNAGADRLNQAAPEINIVAKHMSIAEEYVRLMNNNLLPVRVIHHDTKINNVLFDANDDGMCVVDLDTIMPGYFISDVGDMMRTYLSAANEEEQDTGKISINMENFEAIYKGYMSEIGEVLTPLEHSLFIYSGKFMIFMQAIRFLADFLNRNVYYPTQYDGHNLSRAKNQLTLLNLYVNAEEDFRKIIANCR